MDKKRWTAILLGEIILIAVCVVMLVVQIIKKNEYEKFEDRGVPRINISLNEVNLEEIKTGSKETKYDGNELDLYNNGKITRYDGVEIKGRGNSTWYYEQKSYQIKFSEKVDLFGMGKAKKWVLLSMYVDASLVRDDVAFLLAEMIGEKNISRGEFVEVYFDGEYEGLYYLMHKVEIDKYSVDLKNNKGVLFEIDNLRGDEETYYKSYLGNKLILKDLVLEKTEKKDDVIEEFLTIYNEFEKVLESGDYNKVAEIIDLDSFVKYYLINEFSVNPDAYTTSLYLYRNDEEKISFGPVWDFDYAFGNLEWKWQKDENFFSPTEKEQNAQNNLIKLLLKIPGFYEKVANLFNEKIKDRKDFVVQAINDRAEQIIKAAKKNNSKWEVGSFENEIRYLIKWIEKRYDYEEKEYS